jgi:hypothetical protein
VLTSPDGLSWSEHRGDGPAVVVDLASSGERLVAVGYNSWTDPARFLAVSTDGLDWERVDLSQFVDLWPTAVV